MSIRAMTWVWDQALPPNEKIVLLAIADHAHDDGTNAWPSADRIAAMTGYSVRSVRRIIHDMVRAGYLTIEAPGGGRHTSRYAINMAPPAQATNPGQNDTPAVTPASPHPGHQRPPTPANSDIAYKEEPSLNPSIETPSNLGEDDVVVADRIETDSALLPSNRLPVPDDRDTDRNPIWAAFEDVFGYRPIGPEANHWGKLTGDLRSRGAAASDVPIRAARLAAQWGAKALTPASLVKHWDRFGSPIGSATEADEDRLRQGFDRAQRRAELEALDTVPDLDQALADRAADRAAIMEADGELGEPE